VRQVLGQRVLKREPRRRERDQDEQRDKDQGVPHIDLPGAGLGRGEGVGAQTRQQGGPAHRGEIDRWIDVQRSSLHGRDGEVLQKSPKGLGFSYIVGDARMRQQVQRSRDGPLRRDAQALQHVCEAVALRTIICGVNGRPRGIQTHANRLQAGFDQHRESLGPAAVGVDVNRRARKSPAQLAAWTTVARVLLNLDETITKE